MRKIHLFLFLFLATLLSSCFLIPDQNLGKVLNINGKEVPLTSRRVVYVGSTALANQQVDPNAKCQATPLPADCEILAETPQEAGKIVVVRMANFKENIPLNPSRVFVNLGVQQQLKAIVPSSVSKDSLPDSLNLRSVLIKLKFFDGNVTAEQVLSQKADLEVEADAAPNLSFALADTACEPVAGQEGLQMCTYQTTGKSTGILRFNISDVSGLIDVLGKDSKPGATITGSASVRFNNLEGGDFPVNVAGQPVTTGMVLVLSEGDTVISFR